MVALSLIIVDISFGIWHDSDGISLLLFLFYLLSSLVPGEPATRPTASGQVQRKCLSGVGATALSGAFARFETTTIAGGLRQGTTTTTTAGASG